MISPEKALHELSAATGQLLGELDGLSDAQVAGPSLLPGWTRGHVLTHLAHGAGKRLFADSGPAIKLALAGSEAYSNGALHLSCTLAV